ncbi:MAG: ATP-binding cassette domain-containing protein [Thermodesulfovibrionales bacterium]|nr:ATP-binding cassette domain-containing protein [Thermodesulfovibrionales bacterium]
MSQGVKIIEAIELKKYFKIHNGLLKAVDGVNLYLEKGKTVALVGESGCGKSTLARLVVRLIEPSSGKVLFKGRDIFSLKGEELRMFRRAVQYIFQDPYASLNPRMNILSTLSEPLKIHRLVEKREIKERVAALLRSVGLNPEDMHKYPHEFSGGQRQRICIARALSVNPELIVADEPLSSLDVSVQAQILNLLGDLRRDQDLSFLFISHDLRVVHYFSDYVMVMYLGKIVEEAPAEVLFSKPLHPYTEMLLDSIPSITKPKTKKGPLRIDDIPSPVNVPSGCPFHPRCPKRFEPCDRIVPELKEKDGSKVACHLY